MTEIAPRQPNTQWLRVNLVTEGLLYWASKPKNLKLSGYKINKTDLTLLGLVHYLNNYQITPFL